MGSAHNAVGLTAGGGGQGPCYTEVADLDGAILGEKYVLGFDVSVDDAVVMGVG